MLSQSDRYSIQWHDEEHTILYTRIERDWTWTDAHVGIGEVNRIVTESSPPVYVILHFISDVVQMPKGSGAFATLRYLLANDPDAEQLTVIVGQSQFLRRLLQTVSQIYGLNQAVSKIRFVATLDEALTMIEQMQS